MKCRVGKRGLVAVNRSLTGILAAAIVMSQLSGTGLVVRAAEPEVSTEENNVEEAGTEEVSTEEASAEKVSTEETSIEEISTEDTSAEEARTEELSTEEVSTEEMSTEEVGTEEIHTEEVNTEEVSIEEISAEEVSIEEEMQEVTQNKATVEDALFASVYLQFYANGGTCEISMIELTPDHMTLDMPLAQKAGYRFTGWYMDEACTMAFDEKNIVWQAGYTYALYAGYEQLETEEIELIERSLQQYINGVTITVEGNMPKDATLEVRAEELSREEQREIVAESDMITSQEELEAEENTYYSYDISIRYQDVEYEPYLFDEKIEVTFTFADVQELQNADRMEVFHIDDNENVEKIEITDVSESEVSFEADAFSTYILITKVEYTGNKNWTYGFTGDVQTFTAPVAGQYIFECYGAGIKASKGGFAKGTVGLKKGETIYIYVGGQNNTFNGGGEGGAVHHTATNSGGTFNQKVKSDHGCGATDVRVGTGYDSRVIVAGGGGGNGHNGGVVYSYNGSEVCDGPSYTVVNAKNTVKSNEVLGQGSKYATSVSSGVWGTGDSYPDRGEYSSRTVKGGGGGGYYGGQSGYAGTSEVVSHLEYQGKEYQTTDTAVENLVYVGDGKCEVSLYSLQADVITYYNYNMTKLGEAAGLTGSHVNYPITGGIPTRVSDSKYDYTFLGWDDMATEEIENLTDAQTVAVAMNGNRNYIAAYGCQAKSYIVTLDSADAGNAGTTKIVATYHEVLPDITIPVKEGSVFDGYYTERNGAGAKVYSADGKGTTLSEIEEETTLYAHWVQPIISIVSPEDRVVLAGYSGVVLTTDVELCQPMGYTLAYQWFMSYDNTRENGRLIEEADTRKLVIPQGYQPGEYYFYCLIVATNALNGQAVGAYTIPAKMSVEKGIAGMEQVEIETAECIYDATPKTLKAAINNSNPYTIYYSEQPLSTDNYLSVGKKEPNSYVNAGIYTNYIYVTGSDFEDFSGSISMTIHKAEPTVYLSGKNTAYNGQIQTIQAARVYDVNDKKMDIPVAYVFFIDEACTQKTNGSWGAAVEGGAPSAVGTYYVHAVTQETENYVAVATKIPAMFNILGTSVRYSISGYHGKYDGKLHGLQIENQDPANTVIYFSDSVELTSVNYDKAGVTTPYEYSEVGEYPIYYLAVTKVAGGINQYDAGMAKIVIEKAKQNTGGTSGGSGGTGEQEDEDNSDNPSGDEPGGNTPQKPQGTEQAHKHNYELISFVEPTTEEEGKALYRCVECGHELVITYPPCEEPQEDIASEDEKDDTEDREEEENKKTSQKKQPMSSQEKEIEEKEDFEEMSEEIRKALTEAELLRLAETLKGLTEAEIRALYEKGYLNISEEELDRLLSMIRTQIIIDEEKVSLSDNLPEEEEQDVKKIGAGNWKLLWAFLLGAAVMFLLRELMQRRKGGKTEKRTKKESAGKTRKLNE